MRVRGPKPSKKNNLLGEFVLYGIDPAPKDVPKIDVCFFRLKPMVY